MVYAQAPEVERMGCFNWFSLWLVVAGGCEAVCKCRFRSTGSWSVLGVPTFTSAELGWRMLYTNLHLWNQFINLLISYFEDAPFGVVYAPCIYSQDR